LAIIRPQLEALRHKKEDRAKQVLDVKRQIAHIRGEIAATQASEFYPSGGDQDLSLRKLEEYSAQLQTLQWERVSRKQLNMWNDIYTTSGGFVERKLLTQKRNKLP
jgi:protein regulator of cytokinesis 1